MKRASVIAPLVLILIGALFLINNLRGDLSIGRMIAAYWPWVLVVWGGVRILEIATWAGRGLALPRAGVSSGEWAFIVFLCLFGSMFSEGYRITRNWPEGRMVRWGWDMWGEQFDYPVNAEQDSTGVNKVVVENLRGNVRIAGADGNQLKLSGRKVIRAFERARADQAAKETPVVITRQGDILYVRTSLERWTGDERITTSLDISLPKGVAIDVKGRSGDFDISDIKGSLDLDSDNAEVRVQNIGGNVRAEIRKSDIVRALNVKGNLDLKGRGRDLEFENIDGQVSLNFNFSGELQVKNVAKPLRLETDRTDLAFEKLPGHLRMSLGDLEIENVQGPIRVTSRSKDVRIQDFTQGVTIQLDRGDIQLIPGKGALSPVDARTRSGGIEIALPDKSRFEIAASTKRGELNNDFGDPLKLDEEGKGGSIKGTTGAGGPKFVLNTDRGSVMVRRGTVVEANNFFPNAPPAAPKAPAAPPAAVPKPQEQ